MRACDERLIVQIVEVEEKKGILIIPREKDFQVGKVLAVGKGVNQVDPGNFVYLRKHAGYPFTHQDHQYWSLAWHEVLAVVDEL
jgi:co-chaperonin GroES (HSP10)